MTGGTGFVGRSILRFFKNAGLERDVRVSVLSRNPEVFASTYPDLARDIDLIPGDVTRFSWPEKSFTHLIHAAADTSVAASNRPRVLIDTIVAGTARVIDFALARGVERMLFLSSGAVYGRQPEDLELMPETYAGAPDPLDPVSAYGNAKRLAEQLCAISATGQLSITVGRLFAFVGEDLPLGGHFAIGNFIRDALAGGPIRVQGDGSPVRSYLYQGDLARWLLKMLERGRSGTAYNVGSDTPVNMRQLAHIVSEVVAPGCPVSVAKERDDYAGRLRYVPSIERARKELELTPLTCLEDAIRRTVAHKQHARSV